MKFKIYALTMISVSIVGCSKPAPPPINTKAATLEELKSYYQVNCQTEFKMHPFCVDVQNEKSSKTDAQMRRKPGVIANFGTPEEVFGKKGSSSK